MTEINDLESRENICTCTPLDLTMQTNRLLLVTEQRKLIYEFYFKMFQSYKFKQILGLSFAANLHALVSERKYREHCLSSIGV